MVEHVKTKMKFTQAQIGMLAGLLATTASVFAGGSKLAKDLDGYHTNDDVDVIVQFTVPPKQSDFDDVVRAGGAFQRALESANAGHFKFKAGALRALSNNPHVKYVTPDRTVAVTDVYTDDASNASTARSYGWTGKGIGVAVIDSGVSDPPDLPPGT